VRPFLFLEAGMVRRFLCLLALASAGIAQQGPTAPHPPAPPEAGQKQQLLWHRVEEAVQESERGLDGVLGVAILDLTDGRQLLLHADEIFPQASSIKIAVLAELYHQAQQAASGDAGKAKLADTYLVRADDLVAGSDIMLGLTPGVTRLTNRDLATLMVAVSDNSAANVLIERLGMENINRFLQGLGLKNTRLRRKMMDLKAAGEGRENVATPREMMLLLEALYRQRALNPEMTEDFFKLLATHKYDSILAVGLPSDARSANKPGRLEGVRADSGIVFAKNRPFVICVMTTYVGDEKAAEAVISRIAAAAYAYFARVGLASPFGRVISCLPDCR